MVRILKLTLFTDLASCVLVFLLFSLKGDFGTALYAGILTFGNILLPTLAAVLIYIAINSKTIVEKKIEKIIIQAALLSCIFTLGLLIWSAVEAGISRSFTFDNTLSIYISQFSGFLPVAVFEAILIPTLDLLFSKRKVSDNQQTL